MKGLGSVACCLPLMLGSLSSIATAGDIAQFQSLGFSADGRIYAFEEYGIQDGSGFPYSNLYFIDTQTDRFLPETPVKTRLDDEQVPLSKVRRQSLRAAQGLIDTYDFSSNPGALAAFNPLTELGPGATEIRYLAFPAAPPVGKPYTLRLEELPLPVPANCREVIDKAAGFQLRMTENDGQPAADVVHADDAIPASRGCAIGYRLGGVVTFAPRQGSAVHMALVHVLSYGFEGNDGRWIAVPVHP